MIEPDRELSCFEADKDSCIPMMTSSGVCPITPTGMMAISRVLGKKATLEGVDKEGKPVGWCQIKYKLEEKGS